MKVLVVNAGSSSVKVALFGMDGTELLAGSVAEIGGAAQARFGGAAKPVTAPDHEAAMQVCLDALERAGFAARDLAGAGHRVVHGGRDLTAPCRITPDVLSQIEACVPLAPLHNPANLTAIRALSRLTPDLPQAASFDTAFHATNPEVALRYALPVAEDAAGIRRYGFHGLSYAGMVADWVETTGTPLPRRLLALHLGNGASLCAILDGQSVATTMGYSPLDGLTMGTRAGGIDGNAVLRLAERHGIDGAARLLNRESGLLALGGASDMRALLAAGTPEATFAVAHFVYWAVRHSGSMIAAMGGLDAIAFTGGIGENAEPVRDGITAGLAWAGGVPVHVIPAREERRIAAETLRLLSPEPGNTT